MISLTSITHTSRKPKPPAAIQNLYASLPASFLPPSPSPTGEYRSAREDHPQSRDRINDNGEGEIFIRTARKSVGWKQLRNSKRRILDPGTWKSLEIGYSRILHLLNPDNKTVYESYTYHFYPPSFIDDPQRYLSGYLSSEIFNTQFSNFPSAPN